MTFVYVIVGFGEAGGALIDKIAGESLDGSSACLLVMSYTMLRDGGDLSILQQLHNSDPGQSQVHCHRQYMYCRDPVYVMYRARVKYNWLTSHLCHWRARLLCPSS